MHVYSLLRKHASASCVSFAVNARSIHHQGTIKHNEKCARS